MLSEGIHPIKDGLLEVAEEHLRRLYVQDDINEIYDVEQIPFARGKFAQVRRAIHKKSGVHFAAKFLKRRRRGKAADTEIKHEIAVLILCSGSDNIVKLKAVHETLLDTALLLELATGGELQAFLDNEGSLTEAQTRICMREVLKALQFLHKRSIAHLDLKPQNILLTGERLEDGLKLCDFGISRVIKDGSEVKEILGTPDYVAPEVLQYEPLSLQADIWSVGVLTYVLLSGFTPFGGDTKQETFLNISKCCLSFPDDLFEGISQHAIDFIKSTLRIKPSDRMTALECLEHIWLKDESPISSRYLNISTASDDVSGDKIEHDSSIISRNGCQRLKPGIESNGDTKHTTNSQSDNEEYDKENFLTNSASTVVHVANSCSYTKLSTSTMTSTSKYITSSSSRHSRGESCTFIKHQQNTDANDIEILHTSLEKINRVITTSPTSNGTKVNLCLFPDAPTTPKVIRKAPSSESPTSVKALVKKFQLETNDSLSSSSSEERTPIHEDKSGVKYISRNISNNRGDTFKSSCVFCLSCGGPGCRHSGNSVGNKSASNLGLDQGIIC